MERYVKAITGTYDPQKVEQEIFQLWQKEKAYQKAKSKNKGNKKFYFLDGPPYASSAGIHLGTALNKILKDVIIRYRRMKGHFLRDQPGVDCHGLPIEVQVEKMLGFHKKADIEKYGIDKFVKKCKEIALYNAGQLSKQFKNLGVWMDWDNPYLTLKDEYIESAWWLIKKAWENGLLYEGERVVHWCPRCETVLSGYEVAQEYKEVSDPSIYVKFPVKGKEKEYILIWTTTPWTLPSNTGVMVHPDFIYAKVKVDDEIYILALKRCNEVFREIGKEFEVLETFPGQKLEGLRYLPPLLDEVPLQRKLLEEGKAYRVVLSEEYVSLEEGTGCVHSAPGHGEEDFEVGLTYGLPAVCPVDTKGVFTKEAGKYAGLFVKDADKEIIEDLRKKGLLLWSGKVTHRYPHCWRCKTPLLLRLTKQWFIKVSAFKDKMLKENERVKWIPEWAGASRFRNWLESVRDWVISRQRYWGIPLPIWTCSKCGKKIVIGSKDDLLKMAVSVPSEFELHRPWVDQIVLNCECGGKMQRVPDVIDVWFDSGIASFACLGYPRNREEFEQWWPADVVLEGHDQTRGWFYTLLCTSMIAFNRRPYETVVMHGFTLDAEGREMHKSLGNYIAPEEVIEKYGRDPLRLYELQCTLWEDIRFNWNGVKEALRDLNIIWNVYVFASTYMEMDKFNPLEHSLKELLPFMKIEDKWVLSRLQLIIEKVTNNMDKYLFHEALRLLLNFIIEDVSRWYIRLVRRRVWIETEAKEKLAAYTTLYTILRNCLLLLAPFIPFITEALYQKFVRPVEKDAPISVHLCDWPTPIKELVDEKLEQQVMLARDIVSAIIQARQSTKPPIKIRQPLSKAIVVTDSQEVVETVKDLQDLIKDQANIKEVSALHLSEEEKFRNVYVEPNFASLGPKFKQKTAKVVEAIKKLNGREVLKSINEKGFFEIAVDSETIKLTRDDVKFREEILEGYAVGEFLGGRVYLDITVTRELKAEGLAREVIRRLQEMRKEVGLEVEVKIKAFVKCPNNEQADLLKERKELIMREVRAEKLDVLGPKDEEPKTLHAKKWDIDGETYIMGFNPKT
ncbi:MAG: isoleucine--tRNA ligase [Candidatus Baldrarchaeia archaeon]